MDTIPATDLENLQTELDPERLVALARSLHPADLAAAMGEMDEERQVLVFACLDGPEAAEVLSELDVELQQALLALIPLSLASDIVEEMPADDAADLLNELPEGEATAILGAMESEEAADVRELLDYEGDTAGGQMTTEFIAVPDSLTAEETIHLLRELAPEAETIYYLFVVDNEDRLVGIVSLRSLIIANPTDHVADIMSRDVISVSADADQEDAAELIARYNLVAVPVIDEDGRPIGIITVDDAIDVIDEEAAEDVYELGHPVEDAGDAEGTLDLVRHRLSRLVGTLAVALAAGLGMRTLLAALATHEAASFGPGSSSVWVVAAFLPALLTLSWLFETQARASLVSRLASNRDRAERMWMGLANEIGASLLLAMACAAACAAVLYFANPSAEALSVTVVALAAGLAASSVAAYLIPRLVLSHSHDRDRLPASVTIAAHGVGVFAYLGSAYCIGKLW